MLFKWSLKVEHARLENESSAQRLGCRKCFRCNGNGTCIQCDCATSQRQCSDCLPLKKRRCANSAFPLDSSKQLAPPGSRPLSTSAGVPPGPRDSDVCSSSAAVHESTKVLHVDAPSTSASLEQPCSDSIDVLQASNEARCGDDECSSANPASCDSQTASGPTPDADAMKNE